MSATAAKGNRRRKYRRAPIKLTAHEKTMLLVYCQVSREVRHAADAMLWRAFTAGTGDFPMPVHGPHIDPLEPFGATIQRVQSGHLRMSTFDEFEPFWRTRPVSDEGA